MTKKKTINYYEYRCNNYKAWLQPYEDDPHHNGMLTWEEGVDRVIDHYNCEIETIYKDITEENYTQYWEQEDTE